MALAHFQMTHCGSRDFCLQRRLHISHFFFGELKFDRQRLPTSCIPLYYLETEKPTLIFNLHLSLRLLPCDAVCTVSVIVILSVRLSVRLSVTLVDCVHMVRPTIMISSPQGSPIILVSGDITFIPKFEGGHPERGR